MTIEIPTPLRVYVGNQSAVSVDGTTVSDAVAALLAQYPEFKKHLYTPDGKLRSFVNLYLNDEDGEGTSVKGSDTLSIIPSIAGGLLAGGADAGLAVQADALRAKSKPGGLLHLRALEPHP
jgi:adenylyltransferase/sulfurtransferase